MQPIPALSAMLTIGEDAARLQRGIMASWLTLGVFAISRTSYLEARKPEGSDACKNKAG
jgi:hypothetical protein